MRLVTYNMRQGGSRDRAAWERAFPVLAPDILFAQESRDPTQSWLPALGSALGVGIDAASLLWQVVPGGRWGSGLWVRDGELTPLPVPEQFRGRVVAALVGGCDWPSAATEVVALSIHAPTQKGSSYIKEVGHILDFAGALSQGLPLVLAGDFNVVVGMRETGQTMTISRGERVLLERLRDEFGLIPCWQTAHPGEVLARTLRWMHRLDSPAYHCDGFFIPAEWASALESCEVLEDHEWYGLSDHNPVIATLSTGVTTPKLRSASESLR